MPPCGEPCPACGGSGEEYILLNPMWPKGTEPHREATGNPCTWCDGTGVKENEPYPDPRAGHSVYWMQCPVHGLAPPVVTEDRHATHCSDCDRRMRRVRLIPEQTEAT